MRISIETWKGTSFELELFLTNLLRMARGEPIYLEVNKKKYVILTDQSLDHIIDEIMTN